MRDRSLRPCLSPNYPVTFPGPVLAQVAVPFYSADRQRVLVPRGARVIGTASAVLGQDQERLAVSVSIG